MQVCQLCYICMHIHACQLAGIHVCIRHVVYMWYIYTTIHTCMYINVYMYTCIQIYVYMCMHLQKQHPPPSLQSSYILYTNTNTGWRRCIGCLRLQVSFRKRTTNYRALLRKTTYKDKASYGSAPPCKHI